MEIRIHRFEGSKSAKFHFSRKTTKSQRTSENIECQCFFVNLQKRIFRFWARDTDFGAGIALTWESRVWGSRVWGSTGLGLPISELESYIPGGLESGGLESGGLQGSGHRFRIWTSTCLSLRRDIEDPYSATLPLFREPCLHLIHTLSKLDINLV